MTTGRIPTKEQLENLRREKLGVGNTIVNTIRNYGGYDYGREDLGGARPVAGFATVDNPTQGDPGDENEYSSDIDYGTEPYEPDYETDPDPDEYSEEAALESEYDGELDSAMQAMDEVIARGVADAKAADQGLTVYYCCEKMERQIANDEEFESIASLINFLREKGYDTDEGTPEKDVLDGAERLFDNYDAKQDAAREAARLEARAATKLDQRIGPDTRGGVLFSNVDRDPLVETRTATQKIIDGLAKMQAPVFRIAPGTKTPVGEDRRNPKDRLGSLKLSLGYLPGPGMVYAALGMMNGGIKYDPYNWRENDVLASVYVDAIERHLTLMKDGEWVDTDSGLPHLSHLLANGFILADAFEMGVLINDLQTDGCTGRLLAEWNEKLKTTLIPKWKEERRIREEKNK